MIDREYDLHNFNLFTPEDVIYYVEKILDEAFDEELKSIRIITGRNIASPNPPMIRSNTEKVLKKHKKVNRFFLEETMGSFVIFISN